jgi:hypothetical protein
MDGMTEHDTRPRIILRVERMKDGKVRVVEREIAVGAFLACRFALADAEISEMLRELEDDA